MRRGDRPAQVRVALARLAQQDEAQAIAAPGRQLKGQATVLLVEQNFNFVRQLGDTVAVMDDGRIVHSGSMAELAADRALQQRLLGLALDSHQ